MRKCEKVILTERVTPRVGSVAHCLSKCNVRGNESMSIDDKYNVLNIRFLKTVLSTERFNMELRKRRFRDRVSLTILDEHNRRNCHSAR